MDEPWRNPLFDLSKTIQKELDGISRLKVSVEKMATENLYPFLNTDSFTLVVGIPNRKKQSLKSGIVLKDMGSTR